MKNYENGEKLATHRGKQPEDYWTRLRWRHEEWGRFRRETRGRPHYQRSIPRGSPPFVSGGSAAATVADRTLLFLKTTAATTSLLCSSEKQKKRKEVSFLMIGTLIKLLCDWGRVLVPVRLLSSACNVGDKERERLLRGERGTAGG